ncbi:MAG: prolyl-tRNA synthetase associated domain-containing protein [Rhizobiaceae bacterium]|nr:prolyl-tRNA synthetase associated domain-containing protein [Rhizobiaceae bacterium]
MPPDDARLPLSPEALFAELAHLGITHETVTHPPLHTVEESKALRGALPGGHTKNLFLKDKKGRHFLVSMEEDCAVDLKTLHTRIGGTGRVSFGNSEDMMRLLGVIPGSVTLFGVINDHHGEVTVFIDEGLLAHEMINAHPLTNEATTTLATADMLRFLDACGHAAQVLARVPNDARTEGDATITALNRRD